MYRDALVVQVTTEYRSHSDRICPYILLPDEYHVARTTLILIYELPVCDMNDNIPEAPISQQLLPASDIMSLWEPRKEKEPKDWMTIGR